MEKILNVPKLKFIIFILLFFFSFSNSFAQLQRQNYKILGIRVEGNTSTDASTIILNSGLKTGDEIEVPGDQTVNAINKLFNIKIFEDIQVLVEKKIDNGAFLVIKVKEYPRIEKFILEGNDDVSESDIKKKVDFIPGQTIKPRDKHNIVSKIKKLYEEEGYLKPTISPKEYIFAQADTSDDELIVTWVNKENTDETYKTEYDLSDFKSTKSIDRIKNRILLLCKIKEGYESVLRQIEFEGNVEFSDDDLKDAFDETQESKWWKFWKSAKFDRVKFEKDKELLVNFYKKNGYKDIEIVNDTLVFADNNEDLKLIVRVNEGTKFYIRNVNWTGNTVFPADFLTQRLDLKKGEVYNYDKFVKNLAQSEKQDDISAMYTDQGYFRFQPIPEELKVGKDSIDLNIRLLENKRFSIERVEVTGNDRTQDKVIRRELYTIPGDFFSRSLVIRSLQQLANLQYFNIEKLYKEGVNPIQLSDSTVKLTYLVEEKSSDYINASVGYSEYWGLTGSIGLTLSNFSLSKPFTQGGGQILNFNWQFGVGNYYRTFSLGFTEPWFMDTPTSLGFNIFDSEQNYNYQYRQTGATVTVGRRLTWPDNFFYIQGHVRYQSNNVKEGGNWYTEGKSEQYNLGVTISRNDIDNPIFPSRGSKFSLEADISGGPFLPGDVDFYKINLKLDWYKNLFNSNRIAVYSGIDFGYIKELQSGTPIPIFEMYALGGNGMTYATTPLRGYDDRTVGPKVAGDNSTNNQTRGGLFMAKYVFELRAALALDPMPVYVLGFAEAGNVFPDMANANPFDLKRSVGLGARILINPIGLIGFDYGYGFDRRSVDGKDPQWQFHFQFGKGL